MKKYLMAGLASLALSAAFMSCSNDDFEEWTQEKADKAKYDQAFLAYVGGSISANQDWGFGASTSVTRGFTRSMSSPFVGDINAPYDAAWVTNYLETAKEPTSANVADNFDNGSWERTGADNNIDWNDAQQVADRTYFWNNLSWPYTESDLAWINANHPDWIRWKSDPDFVTNFKITDTWDGAIAVAGSEGSSSPGAERTIVVTGTWNITADQRIGSLGKIIIADGGTVNVAEGKTLNMVNQARLVVLRGGKLTGAGMVEVNNGNADGLENYNGGTIDVAVFNNNFGKFYNYGNFLVTEYRGGAQESNFYNHALVSIKHTGLGSETPNARIFNGCQWYCEGDMRARNYEGVNGSAFIVGGQLMLSSSEDGTSTPSYVGLAAGALVKVGSLYNNGTSWSGPTSGYAALEIVNQIDFLNWEQDAPQTGGYFENNIYVKSGNWDNIPLGNGYQAGETATADYKFFKIVANCRGNNGVTKVNSGDTELLPADDDFVLGVAGCTPGFKGDLIPDVPELVYDLRIIAEDLCAEEAGDFDFNDVVLDVKFDANNAYLRLMAAGGTLPLRIAGKDEWEVHKLFKVNENVMVNTGHNNHYAVKPVEFRLGSGIADAAAANNITLEVYKNNTWQKLTAVKGEPASKLAVGVDYEWLDERTSIKDSYTKFVDWATKADFQSQWWK